MTPKREIRNVPASIRQRLLNLARNRGIRFNGVLQRYAAERFLYRLSASGEVDRFTLKGAALFRVWQEDELRPTRDVDFLAFGPEDHGAMRTSLEAIFEISCPPDGVVFDPAAIRIDDIRNEQPYGGLRVRVHGMLGRIRLPLQVDIGFGDVITPEREERDYPTLLDLPVPRLWTYPRETVVAEKFEAMVRLGAMNARVKDLWDIACLARHFAFDGETLRTAIKETFPAPPNIVRGRETGGVTTRLLPRHRPQPAVAGAAKADRAGRRRPGPARGCGRGVGPFLGPGLRQPERGQSVHTSLAQWRAVAAGDSGPDGR